MFIVHFILSLNIHECNRALSMCRAGLLRCGATIRRAVGCRSCRICGKRLLLLAEVERTSAALSSVLDESSFYLLHEMFVLRRNATSYRRFRVVALMFEK